MNFFASVEFWLAKELAEMIWAVGLIFGLVAVLMIFLLVQKTIRRRHPASEPSLPPDV